MEEMEWFFKEEIFFSIANEESEFKDKHNYFN